MRITKRQLRQIINESLFGKRRLFEDGTEPDQKHSGKGQGLAVYVGDNPESASDNSSALKVISDGTGAPTLKAAFKALGTSYSGDYYVWSKRNPGNSFVQLGEYYKKGSGDPYTYEKVGEAEGGKTKYRVISGPFNKGKYTSGKLAGKTIGTHPIGAIFTMGKELEPVPQPEPVVEDIASINLRIIDRLERVRDFVDAFSEILIRSGTLSAAIPAAFKYFYKFKDGTYSVKSINSWIEEAKAFQKMDNANIDPQKFGKFLNKIANGEIAYTAKQAQADLPSIKRDDLPDLAKIAEGAINGLKKELAKYNSDQKAAYTVDRKKASPQTS